MSIQGHQRLWHQSKALWDFLLFLNSTPLLPRFRDIRAFVGRKPLFPYPTLFRPEFRSVPFGIDAWFGYLQRANTSYRS